MGFLGNIGRSIVHGISDIGHSITHNPLDHIIGGAINPALGTASILNGVLTDKKKKSPSYQEPADLRNIRNQLSGDAKKFRAGLGQYEQEQYAGLLPSYNESLKQGTRNINDNYASRGLLYSGLRANDQGNLKSKLAGELSKQRYDINRESESLARTKEQAASATGLQMANQLQAQAENLYNTQMANQVARRQAFGQLVGGVGYGVGAYYGNKQANNSLFNAPPDTTGAYQMPASNYNYNPAVGYAKLTAPGTPGLMGQYNSDQKKKIEDYYRLRGVTV